MDSSDSEEVRGAWIRILGERDADADLARLYREVADPRSGRVDAILRVHSLHPEGLRAHFALYRAVMRGTKTLPAVDRELIAFAVSRWNDCHY